MHSLSGSGSSVSYTQCGVYTALKAVNPVSSMEYIVAFFLFVFFFLPLFFSFFLFHLGNFQMLCFTPIFTPFSWREEERKKKKQIVNITTATFSLISYCTSCVQHTGTQQMANHLTGWQQEKEKKICIE